MASLSREQLLEILESLLSAQLRALRALRRRHRGPASPSRRKRSNISIVIDILKSSGGPLHIDDIIRHARLRFARTISRESLVSALTKKILDRQTFVRVGKSTFDLLDRVAETTDPGGLGTPGQG